LLYDFGLIFRNDDNDGFYSQSDLVHFTNNNNNDGKEDNQDLLHHPSTDNVKRQVSSEKVINSAFEKKHFYFL